MQFRRLISLFISLSFIACNTSTPSNTEQTITETQLDSTSEDVVPETPLPTDSIELKECSHEEDVINNDYLKEELVSIRQNFKRINSIDKWESISTKELWESTEGGQVNYYYSKQGLEKIVARQFGETGQLLIEYYLINGKLSFVFQKSYRYNRPLFYDSASMKMNDDDQVFDFELSEIIEDRSYFKNGKLLHQINSQDCGAPFSEEYLQDEQKRLMKEFEKLMTLSKKH
jgi:hypothetical protein